MRWQPILVFQRLTSACYLKKKTGQTPQNFVAYLKVQKACHLLEFSDQKVSEIADQLGYIDSFYFSRVFSKVMGMSPAKFRKMRLA